MSDPRNDDWSWFRELLVPLRPSSPKSRHPSHAVLRAYMEGRLHDEWRARMHPFDPQDWTLTEVSQHALVCRDCAQQLALLRRQELEHVTTGRALWQRFPSAIRAHVALYALALLGLFALNVFLVAVLPAPVVSRTCVPSGDIAGPGEPVNSQTADKSAKLEGLNRPVKLPGSLSGTCTPVPAPRPLWQTWWIGWVFLVWTTLLGLHILWDWLISPELQRPVLVSTALRSFV